MKRLIASALCCGLMLVVPAQAGINKCKGADGKLYYTDQECPTATNLESSELTQADKIKIKREDQDQKDRAEWEETQKKLDVYRENKKTTQVAHLKSLLNEGKITKLEYITIQQKGIFIGMSQLALELSWGKPSSINKSGLGSDQWIYATGTIRRNYAYVENGKVTNWQSSE